MTLWPYLIIAILYGACVGSFLNVVIYRLPAGLSLLHPPSQCPKCKTKLAAYDNVPVLGWLWLRGKCRYCSVPISVQYPAVEAVCGLLFGALFVGYYMIEGLRPDFFSLGLASTWVVLIVHLMLIAALFAATVIDARHYIIPLSIPYTVMVIALVGLPVATMFAPDLARTSVVPGLRGESLFGIVPRVSGIWFGAAAGGALGVVLACGLAMIGLLPRSFDGPQWDEAMPGSHDQPVEVSKSEAATQADERSATAPPEDAEKLQQWLAPPGLRKEIGKECLFVLIPVLGFILGAWLWPRISPFSPELMEPPWLRVLGGVLTGYLIGGALIWGTRIIFTLVLGKEAMGLGDVHLLAAIAAILGPLDSVLVFFLAPVFGLIYALGAFGASMLFRRRMQPIPYGPYLAGAAVVMMLFRQPVAAWVLDAFQLHY